MNFKAIIWNETSAWMYCYEIDMKEDVNDEGFLYRSLKIEFQYEPHFDFPNEKAKKILDFGISN